MVDAPPPAPQVVVAETQTQRSSSEDELATGWLSGRYDYASGYHSFGLGYRLGSPLVGKAAYGELGPDVGVITHGVEGIAAGFLSLRPRFGFCLATSCLSVEVSLSLARDGDWRGIGGVGAFYGWRILDAGVVVTGPVGPLDRPEWLPAVQFGLRVQVPLSGFPRANVEPVKPPGPS